MTVIAAVVKEGKIWMGCDSAAADTESGALTLMRDSKVARLGKHLLIGASGELRLVNIVHHVFEPPNPTARTADMAYLCGPFTTKLRKAFEDNAWDKPRDAEGNGGHEFALVIGYRGSLYFMDSDLDICRSADDFEACGSGGDIAKGSLHATHKMAPRARVLKALAAAERYNAYVRRPFRIHTA